MKGKTSKFKVIAIATIIVALLAVIGCGSSTRNDQGVSFTFFGWFGDAQGLTGVATLSMPIAGENPETDGFGNDVVAYAGLQNNLQGQFIRIERLFHKFHVPGGTIKIPDTSVGVPGTLAAAGPQEGSSLPDGAGTFGNGGNVGYFGALVVPRSVREFIALNRSGFPEPPFVMVVSTYASGVTSAGNRMTSNRVEIEVVVEPEIIIAPTEGDTSNISEDLELDEVDDEFDDSSDSSDS